MMKSIWKMLPFSLIFCLTLALSPGESTSVRAAVSSPAKITTTSAQNGKQNETQLLFRSARKVGVQIAKARFRYGKSKATNFEKSKKGKRSFCADYVTWALQEKGDLAKNLRIYGTRNGKLAGSGRKAILKNYRIIYVHKRTDHVKFQPGDIICNYKLSGKFGWHMMIFARYNKAHHPLWYSGGSDATRYDGYYSKYKLTTPRRLPGYEKKMTAYILRKK